MQREVQQQEVYDDSSGRLDSKGNPDKPTAAKTDADEAVAAAADSPDTSVSRVGLLPQACPRSLPLNPCQPCALHTEL